MTDTTDNTTMADKIKLVVAAALVVAGVVGYYVLAASSDPAAHPRGAGGHRGGRGGRA